MLLDDGVFVADEVQEVPGDTEAEGEQEGVRRAHGTLAHEAGLQRPIRRVGGGAFPHEPRP